VSETELMQMREDFKAGRLKLRVEDGVLNLKEYNDFLLKMRHPFQVLKRYSKRTLNMNAVVGMRQVWLNMFLKV
jgi:hypothetical protein